MLNPSWDASQLMQHQEIERKKKQTAIDIGRMLDNVILPSLDLFANYKNW
jgi:hypothetical protein